MFIFHNVVRLKYSIERAEVYEGLVLKTHNLSKSMEQWAVDNVNMTIEKDRFTALLAKGAGKTTLIRLITGLIHRTSGEIELLGASTEAELNKARTRVAWLKLQPLWQYDLEKTLKCQG